MKILILGAGGWGALVGAHLAEAGADVVLLFRRQAHVDEIKKNGNKLIIEKPDGRIFVPVHAITDPNEIKETDLMIVESRIMILRVHSTVLRTFRSKLSPQFKMDLDMLKDLQKLIRMLKYCVL